MNKMKVKRIISFIILKIDYSILIAIVFAAIQISFLVDLIVLK